MKNITMNEITIPVALSLENNYWSSGFDIADSMIGEKENCVPTSKRRKRQAWKPFSFTCCSIFGLSI